MTHYIIFLLCSGRRPSYTQTEMAHWQRENKIQNFVIMLDVSPIEEKKFIDRKIKNKIL